jgi:hypothetical protein
VNKYVVRVGGAIRFAGMNESRVGGACGPPPPFVAPLVPRCALTTGATPRDVLPPSCASFAPHVLALRALIVRHCLSVVDNAILITDRVTSQVLDLPSRRRRPSTSRGVAPVVSAQRGTSGATNGGGGPQAPPTRLSLWTPTRLSLWTPTRLSLWLPTRLSLWTPTRRSFVDCPLMAPPTRVSFNVAKV